MLKYLWAVDGLLPFARADQRQLANENANWSSTRFRSEKFSRTVVSFIVRWKTHAFYFYFADIFFKVDKPFGGARPRYPPCEQSDGDG